MQKVIAAIDLKAFYAYVECVERNLNPFTTPLAVCDPTRGKNTIILSVSPYLKSKGVPSRCRFEELPKDMKIIHAIPRMGLYLKKSAEVVKIFLEFVGEDDLHVYSIDESFLNLGPYLKYYNCTPEQLVQKIQKKIKDKLNLCATAGIGPNIFIAKTALDIEGKKKEPYCATWTLEDIKTKFWPLKPPSKMWGISHGIENRLKKLGITSIGELANAKKITLMDEFGIIGEEIWNHANGRDDSDIRNPYIPINSSLTQGQMLMKDYSKKEARLIVKEVVDELMPRLLRQNLMLNVLSITVLYSMNSKIDPFSKSLKLPAPTNDESIILQNLLSIYEANVKTNKAIRGIHVSFGGLVNKHRLPISLIPDETENPKNKSLSESMLKIRNKYGSDALLRTSSLLKESTIKTRHTLIGGHRK